MSVEAHFWFAPGVEVMRGQRVPHPPPRDIRIPIKQPFPSAAMLEWRGEFTEWYAADVAIPQDATSRLANYSPSGEVAHYEIEPRPPRGWRWIAVDGTIHIERSTE